MNQVCLFLSIFVIGISAFAQPSYYQGKCIFDGTKVVLPLQEDYPSTYPKIANKIATKVSVNVADITNLQSQWGSIEPNGDLVYFTDNNYPDKPQGTIPYCEANNVDVIKFTNAGPFNGHDIISYTLANGTIGSVVIEVNAGDNERQLRYIEELEAVRSGLDKNYILMRPLSFKMPSHYLDAQTNMSPISGWQFVDEQTEANQTAATYPDKWGWEPIGNGNVTWRGDIPYGTLAKAFINYVRPTNYDARATNQQQNGFSGEFNGNGYDIASLYINRFSDTHGGDNYIGFFGYLFTGTVNYLGLTDVQVTGGALCGALCGYITSTSNKSANVNSCYATGYVEGSGYVGGLIGGTRHGISHIDNMWSNVKIRVKSCPANNYYNEGMGGEWFNMKYFGGTLGILRDCHLTGAMSLIGEGVIDLSKFTTTDGRPAGGVVGAIFGEGRYASIANVLAYGDIIGSKDIASGGVLGDDKSTGASIKNYWSYEGQIVVNSSSSTTGFVPQGAKLSDFYDSEWYVNKLNLPQSKWCFDILPNKFPTLIGPNGPMGLNYSIEVANAEVYFHLNGGKAKNNEGIEHLGPFNQLVYNDTQVRDPGNAHYSNAAIQDVKKDGYWLMGWYCLYSNSPVKILDPWDFNQTINTGSEYLVDSLGIPCLHLYAKWACLDCHNGVQNIGDPNLTNRKNIPLELSSQDWRCDTVKIWQPIVIKSNATVRICDYVGAIQLMGVDISLEDSAELIAPQTDFKGTVWPYVHSRECNTCPMDGYRNNNKLLFDYQE